MPALQHTLEEPRDPRDEDFDTGVYPADGRPDLELSEIVRRARAALAGSPGLPDAVVWARFEERWLRRA